MMLCLVVGVLLLAPLAAHAADYDADLGDVLDGNLPGVTVRVDGTGGWYGQCMGGAFVNDTGATIRVRVPIGMRLVPPDEGVQTMVTAGGEILEIPPGESSQPFVAFCSEMHDAPPSASGDFQNGGFVERDLMAVLQRIADAEAGDSAAQSAVWSVTDGLDISNDEFSQQYVPPAEVPPGRAAGAGLAAGLTGLGLAELTRRMAEIQGVPLPTESDLPAPEGSVPPSSDSSELDEYLDDDGDGLTQGDSEGAKPPTGDDDGLDEDGDKLYQDPDETTKPAEETPPKTDDKPKPPPAPPKPPRASGDDGGIKWDRTNRRVVVDDGTTHFEAGRGGGWIGIGGAPGPGTNPFELKPPGDVDINEGDVSAHSRGDQVDVTLQTDDDKRPVHLFRDGSSDTTRVQRGHFVLSQQGNRTSIQDLVNGRTTGASYDGSTGDFNVFRDNFRLSRSGDNISITDKTPGGRDVGASYDSQSGDFSLRSGDRAAARTDGAYGYMWGDRNVAYDPNRKFGGYSFPTNGGKGNLSIGGGADGQFGIARTQPLRIGNRDARLNLDYSRMLRDSGGGLDTEFSAGLDVGRVSVNWSPGDKPKFSYNVKF